MKASRLTKLVNARTRAASLRESEAARGRDLAIMLAPQCELHKRSTMAHIALTLGLRCFTGAVRIFGDPGWKVSPASESTLSEYLKLLASRHGASSRVQWTSGSPADEPTIYIGKGPAGRYVADAAGWVAGVNAEVDAACEAEVSACMFSVSATFAQLFSAALLGSARRDSWTFSLSGFTPGASPPSAHRRSQAEVGGITVLGAGAIGGAVAYGLWLSEAKGHVLIVDRDRYDEPNLETTCMIGLEEVRRCLPKAPSLAAVTRREGLRAEGAVKNLGWRDPILALPQRFFICGVDNPETRRELDGCGAKWLLNAGVGGSARDAGHVMFTRHGEGDPALSTLYRNRVGDDGGAHEEPDEHVPEEMKGECSSVPYREVSLAAPFVATAAASLVVAACTGETLALPAYIKLDLLGRQDRVDYGPGRP